jgi:hypothetical protein
VKRNMPIGFRRARDLCDAYGVTVYEPNGKVAAPAAIAMGYPFQAPRWLRRHAPAGLPPPTQPRKYLAPMFAVRPAEQIAPYGFTPIAKALHSITSFAVDDSDGGIVTPSAVVSHRNAPSIKSL